MTRTYTAADFANARFAEHPTGSVAARLYPEHIDPWFGGDDCAYTDQVLADTGWVPVPTKPTITENEYREGIGNFSAFNRVGFDAALRIAGVEVVPDPEPTDEELLAGIIRGIDDWQSITSPELLAKYLNTAGVTAPKEDNRYVTDHHTQNQTTQQHHRTLPRNTVTG